MKFFKLLFLLNIFLECNLPKNNFKPILKLDYINYLNKNNSEENFYESIVFCTNRFLRINDCYRLKIFIIPEKTLSLENLSFNKIVLYEFSKDRIKRSYLYPSLNSRNYYNYIFEKGFEESTDSFDLSMYLAPESIQDSPKHFEKKFVLPDSIVFTLNRPYYDSIVFNGVLSLNNIEKNTIYKDIDSILLDENSCLLDDPNNFEFFDGVCVFQIKKSKKIKQLFISQSASIIYYKNIINLIENKFKH